MVYSMAQLRIENLIKTKQTLGTDLTKIITSLGGWGNQKRGQEETKEKKTFVFHNKRSKGHV